MVAENMNASVVIAPADQSTSNVVVKEEELPAGNFILVGVDIDTTGRRLIDEIVQLAAYTPNDHFEQYIMPYMNLNPAARQRHQVRVISIGFYRMLKSMQTYKIIKSKSEIAALKDFLNWLEQLRAKHANSDGIVLLYHEERKFIPYMILESLKKYGLLDRFTKSVKSFANSLNLAKASMGDTNAKQYSLRKLTKILSKTKDENSSSSENVASDSSGEKRAGSTKNNVAQFERDQFDGNASVRAKLAFHVALQLSNSDRKSEPESSEALENLYNVLKPYTKPVALDIQELDTQNENLERQNSFRPVFLNYFKTTLYHRVRAVKFRIILAEHGFDLPSLNAVWSDKGIEGLDQALQTISNLKPEDKTELLQLLDSFYDPNKSTIKPVVKSNGNRRRNRRSQGGTEPKSGEVTSSRSVSAETGAGGDKSQSLSSVPDSTAKSPSPKKTPRGGRPQRKRNSRHSLNSTVTLTPTTATTTTASATIKAKSESSLLKAGLNNTAPAAVLLPSSTPTPMPIAASN